MSILKRFIRMLSAEPVEQRELHWPGWPEPPVLMTESPPCEMFAVGGMARDRSSGLVFGNPEDWTEPTPAPVPVTAITTGLTDKVARRIAITDADKVAIALEHLRAARRILKQTRASNTTLRVNTAIASALGFLRQKGGAA